MKFGHRDQHLCWCCHIHQLSSKVPSRELLGCLRWRVVGQSCRWSQSMWRFQCRTSNNGNENFHNALASSFSFCSIYRRICSEGTELIFHHLRFRPRLLAKATNCQMFSLLRHLFQSLAYYIFFFAQNWKSGCFVPSHFILFRLFHPFLSIDSTITHRSFPHLLFP